MYKIRKLAKTDLYGTSVYGLTMATEKLGCDAKVFMFNDKEQVLINIVIAYFIHKTHITVEIHKNHPIPDCLNKKQNLDRELSFYHTQAAEIQIKEFSP